MTRALDIEVQKAQANELREMRKRMREYEESCRRQSEHIAALWRWFLGARA